VALKWWREWSSLRQDRPLLPGPITLDGARNFYSDNTRSLSAVARQLAFAGLAIVWIFKVTSNGSPSIPGNLRVPALLLIGTLAADLLQYICSASSWGLFELLMERKFQTEELNEADQKFGAPNSINWLGNSFLMIKVGLLAVAYVWLGISLYNQLFN
jgi:hypothetical protein